MILYPFLGNLTANIAITFMVNEQEPASALFMAAGMYGDMGTTIFWQIFMLDLIIIRGDRLTSVRSWNFFNFKKTVLAKKSSNIGQVLISSPMFLFCFAHDKFALISLNSALPFWFVYFGI